VGGFSHVERYFLNQYTGFFHKGSIKGRSLQEIKHRLLVEECIQQIGRQTTELSVLFYTHLFRLDPSLADIFNGDAMVLNRKFNSTLSTLKSIRDLEVISAALKGIAQRHVKYHAKVEHFPIFKEALLQALEEFLGSQFTPEIKYAWEHVFDEVSSIMIEVLQQHPQSKLPKKAMKTSKTTLLDDIGGEKVVLSVHQRFYDEIYEDAFIGSFFHFRAKHLLIEKQTAFMVAAFGGPNHYDGAPPAFVHMHMFITKEMSDIRDIYLRRAMFEEGLSQDVCDRWLEVDHSFHAAIEKRKSRECVMRAPVVLPFIVEKPDGYTPPVLLQ